MVRTSGRAIAALAVIASFFTVASLTTGCSGGGGGGNMDFSAGGDSGDSGTPSTPSTEKSAPSIDITGVISTDTVVGSISKSTGKSVAKTTSTEIICEGFTSDGDALGSAVVGADGQYVLAAPIASLKPTDASDDQWNAKFFIKCADTAGRYDFRNYCESRVEEGKTLSVICHATSDTTLATIDFLSKSGCQIGASCAAGDVDPLCFVELQTAVYEGAHDQSSGVREVMAAVRELAGKCLESAKASDLGFPSTSAMLGSILDGTLNDAQLSKCGASTALKEKYLAKAGKVVAQFREVLFTAYANDKSEKKDSICVLTKTDSNFAKKLAATLSLSEDADQLAKMKESAAVEVVQETASQHCGSGSCDVEKVKPEVLIATIKSKVSPEPVRIVEAPKTEAPKSESPRSESSKRESPKPNPVTEILNSVIADKTDNTEQKMESKPEVKAEPTPESPVEDKDVTPPDFYSVVPGAGVWNIGLQTPATIIVREALDSRTINDNVIYVADKNGNKVAGKLKYEPEKFSITFTPDGYQSLSPYTLVVTTGLKDLAGNALREKFTSTFNTGSEPPYGVKTTEGMRSAVVSWSELPGASYYNLYYSTSPDVTTQTGTKIDKINRTNYAFRGLKNETYYFIVTANHTAGKYETEASQRAQATPMDFSIETVASDIGDVNQNIFSSMAMDSNGKVHIAYSDSSGGKNGDLAYATNASGRWVHQIIDNGPFVGEWPDIKVDSSNNVHISYYGGNESSLKYATNDSGRWTITTIDSVRNKTLGQYSSIALDSTSVHIAYWDMSGDLRYATNRNGPWEKYVIDDGEGAYNLPKSKLLGLHTDIKVDPAGTVHISYYDDANGDLKYARKEINKVWLLETVDAQGNVGIGTSLVVDAAQNVYIAYTDSTNGLVKMAKRVNGKWEIQSIDFNGGYEPSIDIDSRGRLMISYRDSVNGAIRLATKGSAGWVTNALAENTSWGGHGTTLLTDTRRANAPGKVHVLYTDQRTHELKYAREN